MAKFAIGSGLFTVLMTMFLYRRWGLTYDVNALLFGSVLGLIIGGIHQFVLAPFLAVRIAQADHLASSEKKKILKNIAVGLVLTWIGALWLTAHWIARKPGFVWQW